MKPFKFVPYLKTTIWGGEQIAPFKGISTELQHIGESWEISGVAGHESVVADRGLTDDADLGKHFPQLIEEYKGELVGNRIYEQYGSTFPLLIKLIDSSQNLSVQVHPDDKLAKERHGCHGKTEMWYVMKTEPGSKIFTGLSKQITPDDYERLATAPVENGHSPMEDVLASYESHPGDLFFLPAGRLHAIGAGNFLAEIQQTSDITYLVYDYGRLDVNGKPRELHIEQAKDAIDYRVYSDYRSAYDAASSNAELVSCPYFRVNRIITEDAIDIDLHTDAFVVVMCLSGDAIVNDVHVRQGETILVPACDNILHISGQATFLTATM